SRSFRFGIGRVLAHNGARPSCAAEEMIMTEAIVAVGLILPLLFIVGVVLASGVRVVQQYEAGVHFRLGRVIGVREPGLTWIIPMGIDRLLKVKTQLVTPPIPWHT